MLFLCTLVAAREPKRHGAEPQNVPSAGSSPLSTVTGRCGCGATLRILTFTVIALPHFFDSFDLEWPQRLQQLEVGLKIPPKRLSSGPVDEITHPSQWTSGQ